MPIFLYSYLAFGKLFRSLFFNLNTLNDFRSTYKMISFSVIFFCLWSRIVFNVKLLFVLGTVFWTKILVFPRKVIFCWNSFLKRYFFGSVSLPLNAVMESRKPQAPSPPVNKIQQQHQQHHNHYHSHQQVYPMQLSKS